MWTECRSQEQLRAMFTASARLQLPRHSVQDVNLPLLRDASETQHVERSGPQGKTWQAKLGQRFGVLRFIPQTRPMRKDARRQVKRRLQGSFRKNGHVLSLSCLRVPTATRFRNYRIHKVYVDSVSHGNVAWSVDLRIPEISSNMFFMNYERTCLKMHLDTLSIYWQNRP